MRFSIIPFLVALFLSVLVLSLLPLRWNKYWINAEGKFLHEGAKEINFIDLDGDGLDEMLFCAYKEGLYTKEQNCDCCTLKKKKSKGDFFSLEQYNNISFNLGPNSSFTANVDKDSEDEFFIFHTKGDSLLLSTFDFDKKSLQMEKKAYFVDTFLTIKHKKNITIKKLLVDSLNDANSKELFFTIQNGFPIYPRRIYRFNKSEGLVSASPSVAFGPTINIKYSDAGKVYFTGSCRLSGNINPNVNIPYPDTMGYAYLLNAKLDFVFPPQALISYPGSVDNTIRWKNLISVYAEAGDDSIIVDVRNLKGEILRSKRFYGHGVHILNHDTASLVIAHYSGLSVINKDLERVHDFGYEGLTMWNIQMTDLNGNGKDELIYRNGVNGRVEVMSDDYKHRTIIDDLSVSNDFFMWFANINETGKQIVLKEGSYIYFYNYQENKWYSFLIPIGILVFLLLWLLSIVVFKEAKRGLENRFAGEDNMLKLQLKTIKNQVDPHFSLNALSSIDYMFRNNEVQRASSYLISLSSLLRHSMQNTNVFAISLKDELSFCRQYCHLEGLRHDNFRFQEDESLKVISAIEVPKFLIFTFVENAIKHGLRPSAKEIRSLSLFFTEESQDYKIHIEDNGVGLQGGKQTSGTGKGLIILEEMLELYEQIKGIKIKTHLVDQGSNGLKVSICIPKR